MIGSLATIEFSEADLRAAVPACATAVAAALCCGFRLRPGPDPNHEDILVGRDLQYDRLQQYRAAPLGSLARLIRWHFRAGRVEALPLGGEPLSAREFFARWQADAAMRRAVEAWPSYAAWQAALRERLLAGRADRRVVMAVDGERMAMGRIGGDPASLAGMAGLMEGGSI